MPAVPARFRAGLLAASLALGAASALAQALPAAPSAAADDLPTHSALDTQLFYQLLIGEIELRGGAAGNAYEVVLDAARRTKDEQLFRRATEIALQGRAGEQALAAVKAWRTALPHSVEAHRFLVQLLVALKRVPEAVEPLRGLIALTPPGERAGVITALPRFLGRTVDERQPAADLVEKVLQGWLDNPATQLAAQVALGRAWLAAGDAPRAATLAAQAHAIDKAADAPAVLAIETLPGQAQAEAVVLSHLNARPQSHGVRQVYVRALMQAQRYADAVAQLERLAVEAPKLAPPLLTLGALHLELRHPAEATAVLQRYLALAAEGAAPSPASAADDEDDDSSDGDAGTEGGTDATRGVTQAHLLLAQAAEQQRDFAAAEAWLAKIDSPARALEVQARRASLLARQGRVADARALIRSAPEKTLADARAKLVAEAQLLRDAKLWGDAMAVFTEANQRFTDDADLLYEQSMVAEKLDRLDVMEALLRRVMAIKPDHHHAYNALGYSLADRGLRLQEARTLIQKALELSPGEPFITDSLGWVEFRLGNRDEALRLLRTAYRARPDAEIGAHLGEVLWALGQQDEARRIWRESKGRDAANDVLRETLARLKVDL
jgi:tetratricopeptide (TPR) repeat protein